MCILRSLWVDCFAITVLATFIIFNPRICLVQWNNDAYEQVLVERTKDACKGLLDIVVCLDSTPRPLQRSLNCLKKVISTGVGMGSAWPHLAKFLKVFGQFLRVYLASCKILNVHLQKICYLAIFHCSKYWKMIYSTGHIGQDCWTILPNWAFISLYQRAPFMSKPFSRLLPLNWFL